MSLARDDAGFIGALDALERSFIKTGTIEKKLSPEQISGPNPTEPGINDVFEKKSSGLFSQTEKLQEDYNNLELKNNELKKIDEDITKLDKKMEEQELPHEQLQDLKARVSEKLKEIRAQQDALVQKVSSLVNLRIGDNAETSEKPFPDNELAAQAEEIKDAVINEVKDNPDAVKKVELKQLNRDLLLALLSLTSG